MKQIFEVTVDPEYGIYANVELIVDATNTDNVNTSIDKIESAFVEEWQVKTDGKFSFFVFN